MTENYIEIYRNMFHSSNSRHVSRRRIASLPALVACGGLPRHVVRLAAEVPGWKHSKVNMYSIYYVYVSKYKYIKYICIYIHEYLCSHVVVLHSYVSWNCNFRILYIKSYIIISNLFESLESVVCLDVSSACKTPMDSQVSTFKRKQ